MALGAPPGHSAPPGAPAVTRAHILAHASADDMGGSAHDTEQTNAGADTAPATNRAENATAGEPRGGGGLERPIWADAAAGDANGEARLPPVEQEIEERVEHERAAWGVRTRALLEQTVAGTLAPDEYEKAAATARHDFRAKTHQVRVEVGEGNLSARTLLQAAYGQLGYGPAAMSQPDKGLMLLFLKSEEDAETMVRDGLAVPARGHLPGARLNVHRALHPRSTYYVETEAPESELMYVLEMTLGDLAEVVDVTPWSKTYVMTTRGGARGPRVTDTPGYRVVLDRICVLDGSHVLLGGEQCALQNIGGCGTCRSGSHAPDKCPHKLRQVAPGRPVPEEEFQVVRPDRAARGRIQAPRQRAFAVGPAAQATEPTAVFALTPRMLHQQAERERTRRQRQAAEEAAAARAVIEAEEARLLDEEHARVAAERAAAAQQQPEQPEMATEEETAQLPAESSASGAEKETSESTLAAVPRATESESEQPRVQDAYMSVSVNKNKRTHRESGEDSEPASPSLPAQPSAAGEPASVTAEPSGKSGSQMPAPQEIAKKRAPSARRRL